MDAKQKHKLKKLVNELSTYRGRHTELVTVYVPAGYDLNKIIAHLQQEQDTASNIKDKNNRKNVVDALERMIRHLRLFKALPKNGLAVFSGNVSPDEGKQDIQVWSIEPPEPLNLRLYRCDQTFKLDALLEMLTSNANYALIAMDVREVTIGMLIGTKIQVLKQMHSGVPGKFRAGGQCLSKLTKVNLADGQYVDVQDILEGDLISSYDFKSQEFIESKVTAVSLTKKDKLYTIKSGKYSVECSADHLFFIGTREVAAENLKVDDVLFDENGDDAIIDSINVRDGDFELVDIEVENKNFLAGGLLVHNSALRFARLRDEAAADFFKRIADFVNEQFLAMGKDLKGIIIGGPGMTKEKFVAGAFINNELKKKILGVKDLSYTNEFGLNELVERSQDLFLEDELSKEKNRMNEFLGTIGSDSEKAVYGESDVRRALEYGAVAKLLVLENNKEVDFFEEKCEETGAEFFVISEDTEWGTQLKNLGGVGAILRFGIGE